MGKDYLLCDYNRDGDSYRWVCEWDAVIIGRSGMGVMFTGIVWPTLKNNRYHC
jgi:hypothetical protein